MVSGSCFVTSTTFTFAAWPSSTPVVSLKQHYRGTTHMLTCSEWHFTPGWSLTSHNTHRCSISNLDLTLLGHYLRTVLTHWINKKCRATLTVTLSRLLVFDGAAVYPFLEATLAFLQNQLNEFGHLSSASAKSKSLWWVVLRVHLAALGIYTVSTDWSEIPSSLEYVLCYS